MRREAPPAPEKDFSSFMDSVDYDSPEFCWNYYNSCAKMISDKYRILLEQEARNLDHISGREKKFELIINLITKGQNAASLELIKELGQIDRNSIHSEIKGCQEKIINLLYLYLGSKNVEELYQELENEPNVPLETLLEQLDKLVGLANVKNQVQRLIKFNKIQKLRTINGLKKTDKTMHLAFLGNPGTGKTSVARIIGKMYRSIGCLSKGHFIEVSRTDLIAEYQGQTAIKVKKLIDRAKGGVLFIDEAYSITENDHCDSYGRECLTELTKALEDYRDDLVVIVAGYTRPMEQFFESNPGLKSRFSNFIFFPDYDVTELLDIFCYLCKEQEYELDDKSKVLVRGWLLDKLDKKDENFSNGRLVRNLFDEVITNQAIRLSNQVKISKQDLARLIDKDIPTVKEVNHDLQEFRRSTDCQ